ncbi:E3 ubiquitin/ISG15 ligase TRIM25-like [Limanda limanda]|uniref:E3 ubiquitin/ISG15 ligase TRIM25-like n=1 Tax=Limanda limanda TaxID=27771 RepID=UPI0029C86FB9|nr:E3 ubiquitin/ISG15 ligase TRIM25-like [Limanda limanda]
MASASSLLSEERLLCSICLDVFTDPVTIPCGHNFCSKCINPYWDSGDTCQCPMCKQKFSTRPELRVNTVMSELANEFKKLVQVKASTPGPQLLEVDVPCYICSEIKEKAVKSCLTCLISFCESHLEPHRRVAGLKGHTLLEPVKNLDDRMCKTHNKMTELYCLKEQAFICVLCLKADHKSHNAVPLEEQYEKLMATNDEAQANIQKLIQTRIEKIAEVEELLDVSQVDSEKEEQAAVQVFTELIQFIQASQAELVEAIEERHSAIKQKGEEFLKELRSEVTELKSRSSQLEHLSQSEDHYHFLQSFPTLSKPPHKSCPDTDLGPDLSFQATRGDLTRLKQSRK